LTRPTVVNEAFVQVAPDSTGAKIRNIRITTLVDGVPTAVLMQAVAVSDQDGNVLGDGAEWREQVLEQLIGIREALTLLAASLE
jgi:hypothetical protein